MGRKDSSALFCTQRYRFWQCAEQRAGKIPAEGDRGELA